MVPHYLKFIFKNSIMLKDKNFRPLLLGLFASIADKYHLRFIDLVIIRILFLLLVFAHSFFWAPLYFLADMIFFLNNPKAQRKREKQVKEDMKKLEKMEKEIDKLKKHKD